MIEAFETSGASPPVKNTSLAVLESRPDHDRYDELNRVIGAGFKTFRTVGDALAEVQETKLYRLDGFATFEAYAFKKWGMSRAHAYRMIDASETAEVLSPVGDISKANEAMMRAISPMVKTYEEDAVRLWNSLLEEHGGNLTAAIVKTAVFEAMRLRDQVDSADTVEALEIVRDTYCIDASGLLAKLPDALRELVEQSVQTKGRTDFRFGMKGKKRGADIGTIRKAIKKHQHILLEALSDEDREMLEPHVGKMKLEEVKQLVDMFPELDEEDKKLRLLGMLAVGKEEDGPWEPMSVMSEELLKLEEADVQALVEARGAQHLTDLGELLTRLRKFGAKITDLIPSVAALEEMQAGSAGVEA